MKYNLEWFVIGLIVFWIVETLVIFTGQCEHLHPYLETMLPLFFWGICSWFEPKRRIK